MEGGGGGGTGLWVLVIGLSILVIGLSILVIGLNKVFWSLFGLDILVRLRHFKKKSHLFYLTV